MLCKKVDKVWRLQVPWSLPNELLTGPTFYFYFVFIFPDLNQLLFLCRDITVYWKGLGCAQETYCLQKQVTSSLGVCSTKHFASWYGRNNFSNKGKNGIGWVIFLRIPLWLSAGWRHRFSPCLWNQKLMQPHRDFFPLWLPPVLGHMLVSSKHPQEVSVVGHTCTPGPTPWLLRVSSCLVHSMQPEATACTASSVGKIQVGPILCKTPAVHCGSRLPRPFSEKVFSIGGWWAPIFLMFMQVLRIDMVYAVIIYYTFWTSDPLVVKPYEPLAVIWPELSIHLSTNWAKIQLLCFLWVEVLNNLDTG